MSVKSARAAKCHTRKVKESLVHSCWFTSTHAGMGHREQIPKVRPLR